MARIIGDERHKMFPLAKEPGLVEKFELTGGGGSLNASHLREFEYLAPGETREFAKGTQIQVVSFGSLSLRDGRKDWLEMVHVNLADGARLTGPMLWKDAQESRKEIKAPRFRALPEPLRRALFWAFALPTGYWALISVEAMMKGSVDFEIGTIGAISILMGAFYFYNEVLAINEAAVKDGRILVHAPEEKYWA